jgi:hypothetical protein
MKIKILSLGIVLLLNIASIFAQSGTAGPLTWNIGNKMLTISGTGAMPDYNAHEWKGVVVTTAPWGDEYSHSFSTVVITRGVTNIGECAFFGCGGIDSIDIAGSITKIGANAFYFCWRLKSVVLPYGVTTIGEGTFYSSWLVSITLPSSITSIEGGAFSRCSALKSITNLNPIPIAIDRGVFDENISACTLYVPKGSVAAYQQAEVWKEFNIVGGVDVEELRVESGALRVFPNPATGACSIDMPDEFLYERALTLSVYDASGRLVQQIVVDNGVETPQLRLGLEAKGVYFVVLSNGKKEYRGKVVFN